MGSTPRKVGVLLLGLSGDEVFTAASILHSLGCDIPASAVEANFFGSSDIVALNDEVLASAGSSRDDFEPFNAEWMQSATATGFLERAVALLEEEFAGSALFLLADPAIARLVAFWLEALKAAGCDVKILLSAGSLIRGHSASPLDQLLWLRQILDAEYATRDFARFPFDLNLFRQAWPEQLRILQDRLGLQWPKSIASAEFEIAGALADVQVPSDSDSTPSPFSPEWLTETVRILTDWARQPDQAPALALLDRMRAEFDTASTAFGRVVRAAVTRSIRRPSVPNPRRNPSANGQPVRTDAAQLKESLQEERRRNTLLNAEIQQQVEGREAAEAQLLEAQAEIAAHRDRRKEMARVIGNREMKIERLTKDLDDRYQELATLQRHLIRSNPMWLAKAGFRKMARSTRRPAAKS